MGSFAISTTRISKEMSICARRLAIVSRSCGRRSRPANVITTEIRGLSLQRVSFENENLKGQSLAVATNNCRARCGNSLTAVSGDESSQQQTRPPVDRSTDKV